MSTLQILGLIYITIVLLLCLEAYFYTKFDPETERFIKEREEKSKNKN